MPRVPNGWTPPIFRHSTLNLKRSRRHAPHEVRGEAAPRGAASFGVACSGGRRRGGLPRRGGDLEGVPRLHDCERKESPDPNLSEST